jgi:uncharacterized membrane protein
MPSLIGKLFYPQSNAPEAAKLLADILQVKITKTTFHNELEAHPDYPSLLSISDVLDQYGIENLAITIDLNRLGEAPVPFITPIKSGNGTIENFSVVKKITPDTVSFFDPLQHLWTTASIENFLKFFSGTILIAAAGEQAGEKDYDQNIASERKRQIALQFSVFFLPGIALMAGMFSFLQNGNSSYSSFIFLMLALFGSFLGLTLVWYELDQYNPVLSQLCNAGKKVNCGAILNSSAAKIAGISWSTIGFSYFIGQLLLLVFSGITNADTLFVLSGISLLALPYIFYSLYYQYKIAKQWCLICLSVQATLLLQFMTAVIAGWLTSGTIFNINPSWFLIFLTSFFLPFVAVMWLIPVLKKAKESRESQNKLQRLKHNPEVFKTLLGTEKAVVESTEGLGITIGNPAAKYKLIKVCNPYCGPCAKAHLPVEQLLENNPDIQLQIIFTSTNKEGDYRALPVKHLMAIAEMNDMKLTKQALDDWYFAKKTDYMDFAKKYPMNGALEKQNTKIEDMSNWCDKTGINFTPTFFVSYLSAHHAGSQITESKFHQLPDIYSITDLKYFFK